MFNFSFKKWWQFSNLRFYVVNGKWNFKFWLFAKKLYTTKTHVVDTGEFKSDYILSLVPKKKTITYKRFAGYMYGGGIYLDNPGIQTEDRETIEVWKKKGLIK